MSVDKDNIYENQEEDLAAKLKQNQYCDLTFYEHYFDSDANNDQYAGSSGCNVCDHNPYFPFQWTISNFQSSSATLHILATDPSCTVAKFR